MIFKKCILTLCVVMCFYTCMQVEGADKYTDEKRPYEFGFTIDGEQHRHEKKDDKGLIMGEFGFITADGVYHVTVYATDEQGRFKILSMKNLRVKPYPSYKQSTGTARQGHSIDLQTPQPSSPPQLSTTEKLKPISIEPPARSCSHCSIPTTSTPSPAPPPSQENQPINSFYPQEPKSPSVPNLGNVQNPQQTPISPGNQINVPQQQSLGNIPNTPESPLSQPQQTLIAPELPQSNQQPQTAGVPSGRTPKRFDGEQPFAPQNVLEGAPPNKPVLITAQMQIVDKNTDIYKKGPGEKEGLPAGLTKEDMGNLLYTFNYTVGFHGHFEEGYTNGAKQGYYYVTGRNGVRTRVDYVADSKGFRPKITQEVLDLLSDDVPKEETEKDAKYGLKGYEFKWLYYPVETKRR